MSAAKAPAKRAAARDVVEPDSATLVESLRAEVRAFSRRIEHRLDSILESLSKDGHA